MLFGRLRSWGSDGLNCRPDSNVTPACPTACPILPPGTRVRACVVAALPARLITQRRDNGPPPPRDHQDPAPRHGFGVTPTEQCIRPRVRHQAEPVIGSPTQGCASAAEIIDVPRLEGDRSSAPCSPRPSPRARVCAGPERALATRRRALAAISRAKELDQRSSACAKHGGSRVVSSRL